MNKLVSIVLPVYNGERFLAESIESVLSQTYKELELIIVNDCSTDHTEEIVQAYIQKDARIKYYKNQNNLKLPATLNTGFRHARGDYLTWTSDDNMYHENAIETMVRFLEENKQYGLVYCDYNQIDEDGQFIKKMTVLPKQQAIYRDVIGACFLYRREVAETVGEYATDWFLVEDFEYWLRVNMYFQICDLHECLYEYRKHSSSLTATRLTDIEQARTNLLWHYLTLYEQSDMDETVLFKYFNKLLSRKKGLFNKIKTAVNFGSKHKRYYSYMCKRVFTGKTE